MLSIRYLKKFQFYILYLALASCATRSPVEDQNRFPAAVKRSCSDIFASFLDYRAGGMVAKKRYPIGVDPRTSPDWNIMYGFESEYALEDLSKLVTVYGPDPDKFEISPAEWFAKSVEERQSWIQENINGLFSSIREQGHLIKLVEDPELSFLPNRLIRDDTGNLEVILKPVDTLEEFAGQMNILNERLGVGSMQASVSSPSPVFFESDGGVPAKIGFFNFMGDFDTLAKLEVGAGRYASNPKKAAANSFNHPFVGPMSKVKHDKLISYLKANAQGKRMSKRSLNWVSGTDASFKYIGGTAYRPDIVPNERIILEVRDCHVNVDCLMERVLRNTFHFQFGADQFSSAQKLKPFDSQADFAKLPKAVQQMLRKLFPSKGKPDIDYTKDEKLVLEVFRNFAWPLRDWSEHVQLIRRPKLMERIREAQKNYLSKLENITAEMKAGKTSPPEASIRVQGALAEFSTESDLANRMREWQMTHIMNTKEWSTYLNLVLKEAGPLKRAFPRTIQLGPFEARLSAFAERWSQYVKRVSDVKFSFTPDPAIGGRSVSSSKDVLVIDTVSMSARTLEKFKDDYLQTVASGTLSFPLSQNAGHLYTRIGTQVADSYSWAHIGDYKVTRAGERLEAFLLLRPEEELRLRFYVEQVMQDKEGKLGSVSYAGVASGKTMGSLRDNRPKNIRAEGHNCTSWMCLAPIGYNRKTLLELAGSKPSEEVHTNPGWWSYYLTGKAPRERSPLAVYWSPEDLQTTLARVKTGESFQWEFGQH